MALLTMGLEQVRRWKKAPVTSSTAQTPRPPGALSFMYHLVHDAGLQREFRQGAKERRKVMKKFKLEEREQERFEYLEQADKHWEPMLIALLATGLAEVREQYNEAW